MRYTTLLNPKEVTKFPRSDLKNIKEKIEKKLTTNPDVFGKPLRRSLRGYWSLRVDDYRVIYRMDASTVYVLLIAHRSIVYDEAQNYLADE